MSRPVKVSSEWYDALSGSVFRNGITMQEALRRRLEQGVPAVPSRAPNEGAMEPDERNTGHAWLSLLVIGAIIALGAFLIARFLPQPDRARREQDSESALNAGAYPYPYGYPH